VAGVRNHPQRVILAVTTQASVRRSDLPEVVVYRIPDGHPERRPGGAAGAVVEFGVAGEVAGEEDARLAMVLPPFDAWPGGVPVPLEPGNGGPVGMPQGARGKLRGQRTRPWIKTCRACSPANAKISANPKALGAGQALSNTNRQRPGTELLIKRAHAARISADLSADGALVSAGQLASAAGLSASYARALVAEFHVRPPAGHRNGRLASPPPSTAAGGRGQER
jgi:hypothetical protein